MDTRSKFRINIDDYAAIVAECKRVARTGRVKIEVNERYNTQGPERRSFNMLELEPNNGQDFGMDKSLSYFRLYRDVASVDGMVVLDIAVCTRENHGDWEPVEWVNPVFENGRLVSFNQNRLRYFDPGPD